MKSCAILGAGGHGKVVAEIAELNGYNEVIFFDDAFPQTTSLEHWTILGNFHHLCEQLNRFDGVFVAIGNNQVRYEKQQQLQKLNASILSLIHPQAIVSKYAQIKRGSVIMAGAVVNPFSIIDEGCIINTGSTIDHDCFIGAFCHISPGANIAGGVTIGKGSWIGIGAQIKQLVNISNNVVIGAGATVVKNVAQNLTVVGTPAKPLNKSF
jgi:sugar O-acyltransferase (sialic acid O-acetyltransferase NeuD family)